MHLIYFDAKHAVETHDLILKISEGRPGILDLGRLESILEHIQNDDYYPAFIDKLTHLVFEVNKAIALMMAINCQQFSCLLLRPDRKTWLGRPIHRLTSCPYKEQGTVRKLEDEKPILDGICVDASCIGNPGKMEYRGVDMKTGKIIFENKYDEATNNIREFLAIVHALALYKRDGKELKIVYSDSQYAISWVKQKKCNTNLEKNEKNAMVFNHIQRALN